jgi:hypothetical protein
MKERACHHFFLQPASTLHRRYEALRAVFVERRPLKEIARQFGYSYGTLRNLVHEFRRQWATQQVPPFLRNHAWGDHPLPTEANSPGAWRSQQVRMVAG